MMLNWETLQGECPLAVQLIEKRTGFKYSAPYGTLLNEKSAHITYAHLEGFFDDHGWLMTIYPTEFPKWNGILSDTNSIQVFNDPDQFNLVQDRNHAKSLIATITIKYFEEKVKEFMKVPDGALILTEEHIIPSAKDKGLEYTTTSDLTGDGAGLLANSSFVVLKIGDRCVILKNTQGSDYLFNGLILKA